MINRQRGVALLMVLFILALMMILASAMTERTAVMYQHTAVTLDNLQARWYALAAENMAAALLQRDALDSPSQTNLAQSWAQEGRRFTLDDGEIRATIRDGAPALTSMPSTIARMKPAAERPTRPTSSSGCWRCSANRRCAPARSPPPLATGRTATASRG